MFLLKITATAGHAELSLRLTATEFFDGSNFNGIHSVGVGEASLITAILITSVQQDEIASMLLVCDQSID